MRTTIDMPDRLYREAKARAALEGLSLKDLLIHSIEAHLYGTAGEARSVGPTWRKQFEDASRELTQAALSSSVSALEQLRADRSRLDGEP